MEIHISRKWLSWNPIFGSYALTLSPKSSVEVEREPWSLNPSVGSCYNSGTPRGWLSSSLWAEHTLPWDARRLSQARSAEGSCLHLPNVFSALWKVEHLETCLGSVSFPFPHRLYSISVPTSWKEAIILLHPEPSLWGIKQREEFCRCQAKQLLWAMLKEAVSYFIEEATICKTSLSSPSLFVYLSCIYLLIYLSTYPLSIHPATYPISHLS